MGIIGKAAEFAMWAHGGQKRKYTGEPYVVHCCEVAELVAAAGLYDHYVAAAWLHDTLEDQPIRVSYRLLDAEFGQLVADTVCALSDLELGNHAERKLKSRQRLAQASDEAKTIKLADLISNTRSIVRDDPKFAVVYLEEKHAMLQVLKEGDRLLYAEAYRQAYKTEAVEASI